MIFAEVVTDKVANFVTLYHRHLDTSYFIILIESLNSSVKCGRKISKTHRHWKGGVMVHLFSYEDVTDKATNFVTLYHRHLDLL